MTRGLEIPLDLALRPDAAAKRENKKPDVSEYIDM
jgi:hypothetical protein